MQSSIQQLTGICWNKCAVFFSHPVRLSSLHCPQMCHWHSRQILFFERTIMSCKLRRQVLGQQPVHGEEDRGEAQSKRLQLNSNVIHIDTPNSTMYVHLILVFYPISMQHLLARRNKTRLGSLVSASASTESRRPVLSNP